MRSLSLFPDWDYDNVFVISGIRTEGIHSAGSPRIVLWPSAQKTRPDRFLNSSRKHYRLTLDRICLRVSNEHNSHISRKRS
jgi:hypothetical protein